jgi:hypothetical protein
VAEINVDLDAACLNFFKKVAKLSNFSNCTKQRMSCRALPFGATGRELRVYDLGNIAQFGFFFFLFSVVATILAHSSPESPEWNVDGCSMPNLFLQDYGQVAKFFFFCWASPMMHHV